MKKNPILEEPGRLPSQRHLTGEQFLNALRERLPGELTAEQQKRLDVVVEEKVSERPGGFWSADALDLEVINVVQGSVVLVQACQNYYGGSSSGGLSLEIRDESEANVTVDEIGEKARASLGLDEPEDVAEDE